VLESVLNSEPIVEKVSYIVKENRILNKTIIKAKMYDPISRQVLGYEYHIGVIYPSRLCAGKNRYSVPCLEIENELAKFCPDITEQKAYFFNKVIDQSGAELPLFYGILYLGDACPIEDVNGKNRYSFMAAITEYMMSLVYEGAINYTYASDYFFNLHYVGDEINEILYALRQPETIYVDCDGEQVDFILYNLQNIEEYLSKILKLEDLATRYFFKAVVESFYGYLIEEAVVSECQECSTFFRYRKGKKYCSSSCLKSVANRRNYQQKKSKASKPAE
jgi:hypothetical protein